MSTAARLNWPFSLYIPARFVVRGHMRACYFKTVFISSRILESVFFSDPGWFSLRINVFLVASKAVQVRGIFWEALIYYVCCGMEYGRWTVLLFCATYLFWTFGLNGIHFNIFLVQIFNIFMCEGFNLKKNIFIFS